MSGITATAAPTEAGRSLRLKVFASNHKLFVVGSLIFLAIILVAILAPWLAPHAPDKISFSEKLNAPSWDHVMGTDKFGRDIFSRVLYGARTSLTIGVVVTALAMLLGAPIGLVSGYFGGGVDTLLMRFSDVFLAFPPLLLPIAITRRELARHPLGSITTTIDDGDFGSSLFD